ncbi:MAG: undecaprenyl-diphosphate phosphatase [Gammaproteobacteria bacterium]|nr:undecaprenyl-diphosphate phosphatase [Gammaproteobacteria bacterium]
MEIVQAILLALVQGLTEFLPISSSAHLILVPRLLGWSDQGLAFDVAVHMGTLIAVVWYFRSDLRDITRSWLRSLVTRQPDTNARLGWAVVFGTIPAGLAGVAFNGFIETSLRSPLVIAATTAGFGILLWLADRLGKRVRDEHTLDWRDVLVIGLAQALALVPGTSRSGITMTAGMLLGLTRSGAARFSFLLSIPIIVLASGLKLLELLTAEAAVDWVVIAVGLVVAALSAYFCIALFLRFLERTGMAPFAIYRLILAAILIAVFA